MQLKKSSYFYFRKKRLCLILYMNSQLSKYDTNKITELLLTKNRKKETCLYKISLSEVTQSCPTLCDPMDCCPPGSSLHGILQARILEWVAISFSRGSS